MTSFEQIDLNGSYTLEKDRFIGLKPFVEEEDIHSPLFPGLKMPVEDIFKD